MAVTLTILDNRDKSVLETAIKGYAGETFDPIMHPEKTLKGLDERLDRMELGYVQQYPLFANSIERVWILLILN